MDWQAKWRSADVEGFEDGVSRIACLLVALIITSNRGSQGDERAFSLWLH